ncbi:hypothetical protein D3C72_1030600 [compost metagenome]
MAVIDTWRVVRFNSCTPSRVSSSLTLLLTKDLEAPSWSAAAVKLPVSTTEIYSSMPSQIEITASPGHTLRGPSPHAPTRCIWP